MTKITSFTLPPNIERIEDGVFAGALLKSIELPPSVNYIGDSAFAATRITNFTVPKNVKTIGSSIFASNVNYVSPSFNLNYVMSSTSLLTSVIFEKGSVLERLSDRAFEDTFIKTLEIPDTCSLIGHSILRNVKIESLKLPFIGSFLEDTRPRNNGGVYSGNHYLAYLFDYPIRRETKDDIVKSNIDIVPKTLIKITLTKTPKIHNYLFTCCKSLKEINLPAELEEIQDSAFSDCVSLAKLDIPSKVKTVGPFIFSNLTANQHVYIHIPSKPAGWIREYNANTNCIIHWGA